MVCARTGNRWFDVISVFSQLSVVTFFFFSDTATTEIYTLSLHDALPIYPTREPRRSGEPGPGRRPPRWCERPLPHRGRSEEHTSELQSRPHLVCRLLLEKKKPRRHGHSVVHPHYPTAPMTSRQGVSAFRD